MNKYVIIAIAGLMLWLLENSYFGWNVTAQSGAEKFFDAVSFILIFWGVIGDILSGMTIHKDMNVYTKTVNVKSNNPKTP